MKLLKRVIYNFEYKRIEKELENLEGFFENRSEALACLGDEYVEDRNYEKYNRRYDRLYKKFEELKSIKSNLGD